MARRGVALCCWLATVLMLAGCGVGDADDTPTAEPVFTIVTPTPGTPDTGTFDANRPSRYTVREGDNLSDIADELGVTMQALQEANGIENPDAIFVGQVLIVPTPVP